MGKTVLFNSDHRDTLKLLQTQNFVHQLEIQLPKPWTSLPAIAPAPTDLEKNEKEQKQTEKTEVAVEEDPSLLSSAYFQADNVPLSALISPEFRETVKKGTGF